VNGTANRRHRRRLFPSSLRRELPTTSLKPRPWSKSRGGRGTRRPSRLRQQGSNKSQACSPGPFYDILNKAPGGQSGRGRAELLVGLCHALMPVLHPAISKVGQNGITWAVADITGVSFALFARACLERSRRGGTGGCGRNFWSLPHKPRCVCFRRSRPSQTARRTRRVPWQQNRNRRVGHPPLRLPKARVAIGLATWLPASRKTGRSSRSHGGSSGYETSRWERAGCRRAGRSPSLR